MYTRVIPRLDIKGPNLVKGVHLEGLRVLGKPEQFARYYYQHGADELLYMDVVASLYGRNSLLEIIERTAGQIFVPLTVGGGMRSLDDIRDALRAGADKVSINTAALAKPELIRDASRRFGSSTIVVSIEAIKHGSGNYEAYCDNGRESTGVDAIEWAVQAAELGAGELLVTAIDQEGTGRGYDADLIRSIADAGSIPVIACGGAGDLADISAVLTEGHADAVSMASMLHYRAMREFDHEPGAFAREGNTVFLDNPATPGWIHERGIEEVKEHLAANGLETRQGTA